MASVEVCTWLIETANKIDMVSMKTCLHSYSGYSTVNIRC